MVVEADATAARGPISTRFLTSFKSIATSRPSHAGGWLLTLVVLILLAGSLGLSFGNRARPQRWAMVWGGPTEGPTPLSLRIEVFEAEPLPAGVSAEPTEVVITRGTDDRQQMRLNFDAEGTAFVQIPARIETHNLYEVSNVAPVISVLRGSQVLASGKVHLTRQDFWQRRSTRGGWLHGKSEGALSIRVGCRNGVLAVGLPGELELLVTNTDGQPVSSALTLNFEGLETTEQTRSAYLHSDARGRTSVVVLPVDLSASVSIVAGGPGTPSATYFSSIPVEATSTVGTLRAGVIHVDSRVPRPRVYYSLVNDQGRWAAGGIALVCDATARCQGQAALTVEPTSPVWLMLGSEPALDGSNVVGWPVVTSATAIVTESVTVPDRLLLDGRAAVVAEAARLNAARFKRIFAGMLLASLVLLLAVALPLWRARRNNAELLEQWSAVENRTPLDKQRISTVTLLALLLVAMVALIVWAKTRFSGG